MSTVGTFTPIRQSSEKDIVGGNISNPGASSSVGTLACPTSYTTGGFVVDLSKFFTEVDVALVGAAGLFTFEYKPAAAGAPATGKVKAYSLATAAEVAGAVDLSAAAPQIMVVGSYARYS